MPRIARIAVPGVPCHLTQRGNGKQRVFFADADYRIYLDLLRRYSVAHALDIWAYCLMPNHVHLIVVPKRATSMAKALGRTHAEYAKYFNLVRRSCGHVWQARYFSCPLEGAHLGRAMTYVETNPIRAGLVEDSFAYPWSSHIGTPDPAGIVHPDAWRQEYPTIDDDRITDQIRAATRLGRPLGQQAFIEKLEARTGRRLRPNPTRDSTLNPQSQAPLLSFEDNTGD